LSISASSMPPVMGAFVSTQTSQSSTVTKLLKMVRFRRQFLRTQTEPKSRIFQVIRALKKHLHTKHNDKRMQLSADEVSNRRHATGMKPGALPSRCGRKKKRKITDISARRTFPVAGGRLERKNRHSGATGRQT